MDYVYIVVEYQPGMHGDEREYFRAWDDAHNYLLEKGYKPDASWKMAGPWEYVDKLCSYVGEIKMRHVN